MILALWAGVLLAGVGYGEQALTQHWTLPCKLIGYGEQALTQHWTLPCKLTLSDIISPHVPCDQHLLL